MSDTTRSAISLAYEQSSGRTGLDITEFASETHIAFPSPIDHSRWRPFCRVAIGGILTVAGCIALMMFSPLFIYALLAVLPIFGLLAAIEFMSAISKPSANHHDVLVVHAKGIRLELRDGKHVLETEIDWEAIRGYQFRPESLQLALPPVLAFQTIGDDYMIPLYRPIGQDRDVLEVLDRYRQTWTLQTAGSGSGTA